MRYQAATLALAFAAAPLLAQDRAVPRGGGSSGGGSSSSGTSHHSGGSSSSGGSGSSSSGSSGSSGSSSSASPSGTAERRHPRAGTGTGNRYPYYGGGGYYPGYNPWYPWYYPSSYSYGPYWGSYYYGYWPYGAYYSGGYSGGYSRSYRSSSSNDETGAIRVLADPEDAKVYVDGYYAGKVDDFDGFSQRLYVARGPHEILLKHQGYRSQRIRVYVVPGETLKIEHDMEKGEGEETLQDLTGGRGDSSDGRSSPDPRRSAPDDREEATDAEDAEDAPPPQRPARDDAGVDVERGATRGSLALRVWPADASVYVDGEFRGTGRQLRTLEMTPGTHRVEIVRPGFPTFQREVEIRAGQTEDLQVTLEQP